RSGHHHASEFCNRPANTATDALIRRPFSWQFSWIGWVARLLVAFSVLQWLIVSRCLRRGSSPSSRQLRLILLTVVDRTIRCLSLLRRSRMGMPHFFLLLIVVLGVLVPVQAS